MDTVTTFPSHIPPRSEADEAELNRLGGLMVAAGDSGHTVEAELLYDALKAEALAADIRACNRVADKLEGWVANPRMTDVNGWAKSAAALRETARMLAAG